LPEWGTKGGPPSSPEVNIWTGKTVFGGKRTPKNQKGEGKKKITKGGKPTGPLKKTPKIPLNA